MIVTRVSSSSTFSKFQECGRKVSSGPVSVVYVPIESTRPQLAFAVNRKFGNAVDRNRARRRLRNAFDQAISSYEDLFAGAFMLFGSRKVLSRDFQQLVEDLESCCAQLSEASS